MRSKGLKLLLVCLVCLGLVAGGVLFFEALF